MGIAERLRIAPAVWPGRPLEVQPGDLDRIAPGGLGLDLGPFPIRPWDDPFAESPAKYYGFQAPSGHPFLNAPTAEAAGGTVYFGGTPEREQIASLCGLLELSDKVREYAAFLGKATNTLDERYLVQLRIVSRFALERMFGAEISEKSAPFLAQDLTVFDALWEFIEDQQQTWGTGMSGSLGGTMGGNGDWAKEALAFGFMVENGYQGVYRIWSRAWLVTK
jgi:hypothetical protein